MWRISIHRDFDSLEGPLSTCGSHWLGLGKNLLLKSVLGHCGMGPKKNLNMNFYVAIIHFFIQEVFQTADSRGFVSMGAMGALAPTILRKKIILRTTYKKKLLGIWKNSINAQHPQY